jgi:diacylglycerol O-acyltransferase
MAQQLDRNRPLWEIWVVEGLDRDRFAIISKIHHAMIDGSSGVDISQILMRTDRDQSIREPPEYPLRPEPTDRELFTDAMSLRLRGPLRALRGFPRDSERDRQPARRDHPAHSRRACSDGESIFERFRNSHQR